MDKLKYEIAEGGLSQCNCQDCSSHVDVAYHAPRCEYAVWYRKMAEKLPAPAAQEEAE
jgi:hypothetical protein